MQRSRGRRHRSVHDIRVWGGIVEQQHDVRQQSVSAPDIDHAPAAADPARPTAHLPGFVQLLPRDAAGRANDSAQPFEQSVSGEPAQIVVRQTIAGSRRERHRPSMILGVSFSQMNRRSWECGLWLYALASS